MTAFAAAVAVMFADQNMAVDAEYLAGGAGVPVSVRVIRRAPDSLSDFNSGRFVTDSIRIDVQVSECPDLAPGDMFEIGGESFEIIAEPVRDSQRLIWKSVCRAL